MAQSSKGAEVPERIEQSINAGSDQNATRGPAAAPVSAPVVPRDPQAPLDMTYSKVPPTYSNLHTAVLPLSSNVGRGVGGVQQHGRKRGGAMTLYVRGGGGSSSSNETRTSRGGTKKAMRDGSNNGTVALVEDSQDNKDSTLFRGALEVGSKVMHAVKEVLPGVVQPTKQQRCIPAVFVFLFFLVVFIFLLRVAEERTEMISRVVAHDNERNLMVTASLTEQLLEKANEANELMLPFKRTPPAIMEKAIKTVNELTDLREASIRQLHSRMVYPGPVEDIKFLVEEHVAYKVNLARMAREELQWLDEKKRDYIGSQGASGASTVEMKYKQEVEKKQKHRKSEQKSNPEVMPRPLLESGTPKTVLRKSTGETTAHIDSWLTSRVLAVPLVLLLTVIYIRLK